MPDALHPDQKQLLRDTERQLKPLTAAIQTTVRNLVEDYARKIGIPYTTIPHEDRIVLSARLHEVLVGISFGLTNGEIGARLGLSEDTIKTHNRRLQEILGSYDRAHSVRRGFECGLLSRNDRSFGRGYYQTDTASDPAPSEPSE